MTKYILDPNGLSIPLVLIVLEGGIECLYDISFSLKQKIPVILVEGTGRAADILAFAFTHHYTRPT